MRLFRKSERKRKEEINEKLMRQNRELMLKLWKNQSDT